MFAPPAAVRLARQTQKTERLARRLAKPNSEILLESKALWAKLNRKEGTITKVEREEVLQQLMTLLEGRMGAVVNKHDGGRVVQSVRGVILARAKSTGPPPPSPLLAP